MVVVGVAVAVGVGVAAGVAVAVSYTDDEKRALPMRFAYADPPYLGCCKLYEHAHFGGGCWDEIDTHQQLIDRLRSEFPDGWALSLSSTSLGRILPLCGSDIRIGAWVKTFCAFKRNVRPAYAWEPVIFAGGRNPSRGHSHPPPPKNGKATTPKDFIAEPITLRKGLTGAKPERVCGWICDLLGVTPGDTMIDLFVGTGAMTRVAADRTARSEQPVKTK